MPFLLRATPRLDLAWKSLRSEVNLIGDRAFGRHTQPDPQRYGTPPRRCLRSSIRVFGCAADDVVVHAIIEHVVLEGDPEQRLRVGTHLGPGDRRADEVPDHLVEARPLPCDRSMPAYGCPEITLRSLAPVPPTRLYEPPHWMSIPVRPLATFAVPAGFKPKMLFWMMFRSLFSWSMRRPVFDAPANTFRSARAGVPKMLSFAPDSIQCTPLPPVALAAAL